MTIPATVATLLEMAAENNGFDRERPRVGGWSVFGSTQVPLQVWLSPGEGVETWVGLSQRNVARAMEAMSEPLGGALPAGAVGMAVVADYPSLHRFLRRAFQLSRALPDELLRAFEKKTRSMPRSTEVERLTVERVGQEVFREGLLDYWEGRCAVTGLGVVELLRASHIKAWASCGTDAERLDVFNGLLLAPHLDLLFDKGFITVGDGGEVEVSPVLGASDRAALAIDVPLRVRSLAEGHRAYLRWHRATLFRESQEGSAR